MSVLIVFLPSGESHAARWALVDNAEILGEGQIEDGEAPALPHSARPGHVVALVPSETVFARRLAVPGRSERDARRAAPFLVEDQIAQTLDDVIVEAGPVGEDAERFVFAVDAATQARWRHIVVSLGHKPVFAVPDAMVIEGHGADLTALQVGDRVLVQTARGDLNAMPSPEGRDLDIALAEPIATAIDAALADSVLPALAIRLNPRRVIVSEGLDPNLPAPSDSPIALKRVPAPDLAITAAALPFETLERLPSLFGAGLASSLDWVEMLHPWRLAAGLAVAAGLGLAALSAGQAAYLENRAEAYSQARIEAFEQAFPGTPAVDVDVQLRRALVSVGAAEVRGGDFLQLTGALATLLSEVDSVRVDSVRFDAERGGLAVSALYADFGDFEALSAAAEARDIVLEDGGARQSADGVSGDFTVRLP